MPEDSERVSRHGNTWMALDVISFVIGWAAVGVAVLDSLRRIIRKKQTVRRRKALRMNTKRRPR